MKNRRFGFLATTATAIMLCAGPDVAGAGRQTSAQEAAMKIHITSSAFAEGQPIPQKHTCDGPDISPPLQWTNLPPGTQSLALVMEDPDAPMGPWLHWTLYGLAPDTTGLPENLDKTQYLLRGARQGLNDFKRLGYGGPCPPPGKPHRYFFKLYALDMDLGLKPGATLKELRRAMEGHILGEGELMGTYARK